jgi:diadenosine tetraphosphate (Ap4A) HIT family hydrolase
MPLMPGSCALCDAVAAGRPILAFNDAAVAVPDAEPVSPGHALIVSRRHVERLFDLDPREMSGLWALLRAVTQAIERDHAPDGYTVGVNVGAAAGQQVPHVHVHVIPRYAGDVPDPRGGVRCVIPHGGGEGRRGDTRE